MQQNPKPLCENDAENLLALTWRNCEKKTYKDPMVQPEGG
jgi:hypothetical protein